MNFPEASKLEKLKLLLMNQKLILEQMEYTVRKLEEETKRIREIEILK